MLAQGGPDSDYLKENLKKLKKAMENAQKIELPAGGEFHYYKNIPKFAKSMAAQQVKILSLLGSVPGITQAQLAPLDDAEDCGEAMEDIATDLMLQIGSFLDRHKSGVKAGGKRLGDGNLGPSAGIAKKQRRALGTFSHEGSSGITKPQDVFAIKVDNSNSVFVHRWCCADSSEEQAARPARGDGRAAAERRLASHLRGVASAADDHKQHPLRAALDTLQYMSWQSETGEGTAPGNLEDTELTFVDTPEALDKMVKSLAGAREIAIDLEAHSYRSFQGFTCLMQVSTREADWIVDVLTLRSHIGPKLGDMFADPGVQKVLHGADHDVHWLQRDFGIYIVNLFDTGQAARVLEFPSSGLAYLLDHYCNVKADKKYQLADWRVRPIPQDMLEYARIDTHYLLYIHDRLKVDLADKASVPPSLQVQIRSAAGVSHSALATVLERSWKICNSLYEKELFTETAYLQDMQKLKGAFLTQPQEVIYAAVYKWRDSLARSSDESTGYLLPRLAMAEIARRAPNTVRGLLNTADLPPVAKQNAEGLLKAIVAAKEYTTSEQAATRRAASGSATAKAPSLPVKAAAATVGPKPAQKLEDAKPGNPTAGLLRKAVVAPVARSSPSSLAGMLGRAQPKVAQAARPSGLGALLAGSKLGAPKTSAVRAESPALRLLGGMSGAAAPPKAASEGAAGRQQVSDKMRELQASFVLPFALHAPVAGAEEPAEPQEHALQEEAVSRDEEKEEEAEAEEGAGQGESVSEWLGRQRQERDEGPTTQDVPAAETEPALPREFEDFLPMSLLETYRKGPSAGLSNKQSQRLAQQQSHRSKKAEVVPFDYDAVESETPELAGAFKPQLAGSKWRQHARGRGGGRGRFGGRGMDARGRGRGAPAPASGTGRTTTMRPGMHEMSEDSLLKGGKRSALFPRSGNRSGTFK